MGGHAREEEHDSDNGQKSPSPDTEEEKDRQMEQGGAYPEMTPFCIKCTIGRKKVGSRKKSKASNTSLDPITLIEGDLNDIGDAV